MKIWTILVEDDFGNVSDTHCFTERNDADEFCKYVNEESKTGLTAYRPIQSEIYKDVTSAIFEFDENHGV